jgi:DedD protein
MLLDSEPAPVASNIPIRIPDRQSPFQPNLSGPEGITTGLGNSGQASAPIATTNPAQSTPSVAAQVKPDATDKPPQSNTADAAKATPIAKPTTPSTSTQPSATPNAQQRRDDSARALALLEGRSPVASAPSPNAPVRGNFVVQAMSLDSSADAQKQRNVLLSAGLNNAFVDGPVDVNGRPKYRVRVGPFQSREAAQAAQTRLRTQGYGGAFITTQ